jgi:hypothetical protein
MFPFVPREAAWSSPIYNKPFIRVSSVLTHRIASLCLGAVQPDGDGPALEHGGVDPSIVHIL